MDIPQRNVFSIWILADNSFPARKELSQKIVNSKVSFNLQIKMWAEGIADLTLDTEELKEYCEYFQCPRWAFSAVINQASSILSKLTLEEKKEKRNLILRLVLLQV